MHSCIFFVRNHLFLHLILTTYHLYAKMKTSEAVMREIKKIVCIDPYREGFARVLLDDGKYAFLDKNGKLQGRYKHAWPYSEGLACVQFYSYKYAFIDRNGKLQKGRYKWVDSYHEGFAVVMLDVNKCTFVDKNGKLQEGRYKDAGAYSEGFAYVMLDDGKYAFIDKNGKLQEGRYRNAWSYREGFARVQLDDDASTNTTIDKSGNIYLSKRDWLEYIKKAPLSFKFIPPYYFNDEDFIESIDNAVKDVFANKVKTVDSALNNAEEKLAEIRDDFENFCKMRVEKIKIVKEIMQKEEQERLERERVGRERLEQERLKQVKIEQAKEDLIQQINNLDVSKDRG